MSSKRDAFLEFAVAGRTLFRFRFRAVVYTKPFNEGPSEVSLDPPDDFVPGEVVFLHAWRVAQRIKTFAITRKLIRYVSSQERRHYINLMEDFPGCISRLSKSMQRGLRHKKSVFEQSNQQADFFRCYRSPEEIQVFHTLAREVSKLTYQERLDGGLPDSEGFRQELKTLAESGRICAYLLFLEGRPVAFLYFRCFDSYVTAERCGFDPAVARLSPGTVLLILAIEALATEHRYKFLDFGPGDIPYKASLSTGSVLCADIFYFKASLRYATMVLLHFAFNSTTGAVGKFLELIRLKSRLKRWFQSF